MNHTKRPLNVLVVDDNEDSAMTLALLVKVLGHDATECFDGRVAIKMAISANPDLVLLDIGMPGVSGLEVCRTLRQTPEGRNMMIVAQTGWDKESDRALTKEAGFDYHLAKPINTKLLTEVISATQDRLGQL